MRPRQAVPLTTPKADVCLAPVYPEQRRATLLESTLVEVFILNSLNLFRMNTFCGSSRFAQFWCNLNPFRINTCKSVSKQTTLHPLPPKKRQRPFRSDGASAKRAHRLQERRSTGQGLSFPAAEAEEAKSSGISLDGPARWCSPRAPQTATPPVPSAECSSACTSYCQNRAPNASS